MVLQFNVKEFTKAKHVILHISNDFIITNLSAKISQTQDDELGYSYFQFQKFILQNMYNQVHVKTTFRIMIISYLRLNVDYHIWNIGLIPASYWKTIYTKVKDKLTNSSFTGIREYYKSEHWELYDHNMLIKNLGSRWHV
jgi:hypothetical protein